MFKQNSLRARLMVPLTCVVIIIIAIISLVLIIDAKREFEAFSADISILADNFMKQQDKAMLEIEKNQFEAAQLSLRTKADSMANLVAGLAPVVIQTFDFDVLDNYCRALTEDPDIVLAYVTDNTGELLTSFRNENDASLRQITGDVSNLSLDELIKQLKADENVLTIQKEVVYEQEILGKVNLIISRKSAREQVAKIESDFEKMSKSVDSLFASLIKEVDVMVDKATVRSIWQSVVTGLIGIIVLVLSFQLLINKHIIKPVQNVMEIIGEMAMGHLSNRLKMERKDEIGKMGESIDSLCDSLENEVLDSLNRLAAGDLTFRVTPKDENDSLGNALLKMSESLTATIQQIQENASILTESSENLSTISSQLAAGSEEVSTQASNVAVSTEEINVSSHDITRTAEKMSNNMQMLSEVTRKISEEVKEIGLKTSEGAKVRVNALDTVTKAIETINSLQEAAGEINITTATIEEITEQTKLLALNATIEAARAGEAGKGFAVVAGEVKELAQQSAQAAENISALIKDVQDKTEGAVTAINEMSAIIQQLDSTSEAIGTAVRNHSQETENMLEVVSDSKNGADEVTKSIVSLAKGANEVAANIQGVSTGIVDSSKGIRLVSTSSEELATLAVKLQALVDKFNLQQSENT